MYRHARGFTLIEFIIALVLIGLISTLLFAGLRLGGMSWESADLQSGRMTEMRLSREFLRRTLGELRSVTYQDEEAGYLLFWGDEQMLEWVAPLPHNSGSGGLAIYRLSVVTEGEVSQLILDRWLYHPDVYGEFDAGPTWEPMVGITRETTRELASSHLYGRHILVDGVETFGISYYGALDPDEEAQWHEQWEKGVSFPKLVKITLDPVGESWPEMIVSLEQVSGLWYQQTGGFSFGQ